MRIPFGLKLAIGLLAVPAAWAALPQSDVRAESALEFMLNGGARNFGSGPSRYVRRVEPVRPVQRHGYPPEFYDQHGSRDDYAAPRSQNFERIVCERVCDGRRFIMAIQPDDTDHSAQEAMCRAAGGDAETRFLVESFVPGGGSGVRVAGLQTGRSAFAGEACPADVAGSAVTVPILNDSTLERGDIVATSDGFKVFRGRGRGPHKPSDFVPLDPKRLQSAEMKRMEVATIP